MSDEFSTTTETQSAQSPTESTVDSPTATPRRRRGAGRVAGPPPEIPFVPTAQVVAADSELDEEAADAAEPVVAAEAADAAEPVVAVSPYAVAFLAPDETAAPPRRRRGASRPAGAAAAGQDMESEGGPSRGLSDEPEDSDDAQGADDDRDDGQDDGEPGAAPRRRRRGGRGRGRGGQGGQGAAESDDRSDDRSDDQSDAPVGRGGQNPRQPRSSSTSTGTPVSSGADGSEGSDTDDGADTDDDEGSPDGTGSASSRRRRRRRRGGGGGGGGGEGASDDPPNTVTHTRDGVSRVSGSTRLEAKRQRRRDGRTDPRRRAVVTEAEFLARREAVTRTMLVRKTGERTQIAILEDGILAEHYVTKSTATSYAGNIFLGRVQNVLPSMEAAFVDIGKGRNAVLYAGEVSYDPSLAEGGKPPRIEQALSSGQQILVQVTKDPVAHKGARLTAQISLPGRFLVYVPDGPMAGISRKLPESERTRLKAILKRVVPDDAGVIVRTAAEGATEEDIVRDVERLQALWTDIKSRVSKGNAPAMLHGEPDLVVRAVRDVFNEDINELIVADPAVAAEIEEYVGGVAPDLLPRIRRWVENKDIFTAHRVDEQLTKALSRKVNLPSGGSLVIDHTEALTAIDINTGKFTGSGGSLEETVTRNNLEAAEEIARQLRLRDVGGMVIIDFIDMVLEANRDLVLRRLVECLARDRTKHQVSEVTSLGLVQLTRKRVGQGLLESFSETCHHCNGRGLLVSLDGSSSMASGASVPTSRAGVPSPAAVAAKLMAAASAGTSPDDHGGSDESAELGDSEPVEVEEPASA